MSIDKTTEGLKNISKRCHDMLCKLNSGEANECDLISLIFNIREETASMYKQHSNQDIIMEFNKIV